MRIVQMLPTIAYGDAIGNDTIALHNTLLKAGYKAIIVADAIDRRLPRGLAIRYRRYHCRPTDVVIYHLSTGSAMNDAFGDMSCAKKIVIYHNITPPSFFHGYAPAAERSCADGLAAARRLAGKVDYFFADSEFNRQELLAMGYTCPSSVLPILIQFSDYDKAPDETILRKFRNDGMTNIVFTGRIAPNKCHEDVILAFYYYHKYWNPNSRLFLVGRYNKWDLYYGKLVSFVRRLHLQGVVRFPGHIPFTQVLSYYHLADALLCLSRHEGFCVPLVEAMYFSVPVVAYDCCAVGETLGGAGLLSPTNDPQIVAGLLHHLLTDPGLKETVIAGERERLQAFDHKKIKAQFLAELAHILENEEAK